MQTKIQISDQVLRALTNGSYKDYGTVGAFPNLGQVWYNSDSIANILSFADVCKIFYIMMNTAIKPALLIHCLDTSVMKFLEHNDGLYIYECNPNSSTNNAVINYDCSLLSTVAEPKLSFFRVKSSLPMTTHVLCTASLVTHLKQSSNPSSNTTTFSAFALSPDKKLSRARLLIGPNVAALQGKATRSTAAACVPTFEATTPIPAPVLLEHHSNVTLCADLFFVQGMLFFHTISRGIDYRTRTLSLIKPRPPFYTDSNLLYNSTTSVLSLSVIFMVIMNWNPCCRSGAFHPNHRAHGLPFKPLSRLMITHLVDNTIRSPASLVTGAGLPDFTCMGLDFDTYVRVFKDNDPSKTLRARSSLCDIALPYTGNAQGDFNFMSLASGNSIYLRHSWTALPIPEPDIVSIEALAFQEKQSLLQASGLVVKWRPDHPIDDFEYNRNYVPIDPVPFEFDADNYQPIDHDELTDLLADHPL